MALTTIGTNNHGTITTIADPTAVRKEKTKNIWVTKGSSQVYTSFMILEQLSQHRKKTSQSLVIQRKPILNPLIPEVISR